MDAAVIADPRAASDVLLASGWYLDPHRLQNTYTAISELPFKNRYCMSYLGDTCPEALCDAVQHRADHGPDRVDLLGVSSLLLVRADYSRQTLRHPPAGWQVAGETTYSVTWTRSRPVPGAGGVAWTSPGTAVSAVRSGCHAARPSTSTACRPEGARSC